MDEAQITGAASSYARKYALGGLFLLDDTKDADTQDNRPQSQQEPPRQPSNGNHKTEAVKVSKAIEACEYPAAVDKLLSGNLATIGKWPQEWQEKINAQATQKREELGGKVVNQ